MIRNLYDYDCSIPTNFWEVICDKQYKIEELPSKTRNQIRRCLRDCKISKLTARELIVNDGYRVYQEAFKRYRNVVAQPSDREEWENEILKKDDCEFWGVFENSTDILIAWAMNSVKKNVVNYNTLKAIPEMMNKHYPYFGLLFEMNRYYLEVCGYQYVSDGWRTVTEHSNIQPFLEKNFLFRKAYCKLNIKYKTWLGLIIYGLYPFKKFIPSLAIKNLLNLEQINREASQFR